MAKKRLFYCEDCGMTMFKVRKPINCTKCGRVNIGRILTEDDIKSFKD